MGFGEAKRYVVENVVLDELKFKLIMVANIFKVGEIVFSDGYKFFSCICFARRLYEVLYIDMGFSVDVV